MYLCLNYFQDSKLYFINRFEFVDKCKLWNDKIRLKIKG